MTIKKRAIGKITKIEKGKPKKRKLTEDEKDFLKRNDLLEGTDLENYTPEDDIDMAVE